MGIINTNVQKKRGGSKTFGSLQREIILEDTR